MKQFTIDYKGKEEAIEYDEELTIGDVEPVLNACVNINYENMSASKIRFEEYCFQIMTKAIKKAPFVYNTPQELRKAIPASLWNEIVDNVVNEHYSLKVFLVTRVNLIFGRPSKDRASQQKIDSTPKS